MMKAKLLTTSSAIALAALVGAQLPSTQLGQVIGSELGMPSAIAQTVLPSTDNEDGIEPADIGDDDDEDEDDEDEDDDDDDEDDDDEDEDDDDEDEDDDDEDEDEDDEDEDEDDEDEDDDD